MLARRRAQLEHARLRRLAGEGACPPDADLDAVRERAADLLRPEAVVLRLREALDLYLDDGSREADAEIAVPEAPSYLLVHVIQLGDEDSAWTAPVWIDRPRETGR